MQHSLKKFIPFGLMLALLGTGCAQQNTAADAAKPAAVEQKKEDNVYKGTLLDKSNKAKVLSIEMGKGDKAKTVMVKFDDNTKGMEDAVAGHAVIVAFEKRDGEAYATSVKPKLAELPAGVTEIKTAELKALLDKKEPLTLVDSRPAGRYNQSFIPGAISVPVDELEAKKEALLPSDKDKLLLFYCGGPT